MKQVCEAPRWLGVLVVMAIVLILLLLGATFLRAQAPETAEVCYSRWPSIGSPTRAVLSCGWTQWDVRTGDLIDPVPARFRPCGATPFRGCCWGAVRLPLPTPRLWTCLTEPWGIYTRCAVLCPQELTQPLIFADGFDATGDTSAWSVTR